jgi:hypothetical protein
VANTKLAGLDGAAYSVEALRPFGRSMHTPTEGIIRLTISKDRAGWVRGRCGHGPVADLLLTA